MNEQKEMGLENVDDKINDLKKVLFTNFLRIFFLPKSTVKLSLYNYWILIKRPFIKSTISL